MHLRCLRRWTSEELGLARPATVRCMLSLGSGDLALGSDYGMVLLRGDQTLPFPFPAGARREMRRVESLAEHEGVLHVATARGSFSWPFLGEAAGRGLPRDGQGGFDDLRAVHRAPWGLLRGWRTHLEGAQGPGECIAFASLGERVFAGTLDGRVVELFEDRPSRELRVIERGGKGRPVRYLAGQHGCLWLACDGQHLRWDGQAWAGDEVEPYGYAVEPGRLWAIARGGLWLSTGGWLQPVEVDLVRPWALVVHRGDLFVGCKGGLVQLRVV
jgi:hypothetical protein